MKRLFTLRIIDFLLWFSGNDDPLLVQAIFLYLKATKEGRETIPATLWAAKR